MAASNLAESQWTTDVVALAMQVIGMHQLHLPLKLSGLIVEMAEAWEVNSRTMRFLTTAICSASLLLGPGQAFAALESVTIRSC